MTGRLQIQVSPSTQFDPRGLFAPGQNGSIITPSDLDFVTTNTNGPGTVANAGYASAINGLAGTVFDWHAIPSGLSPATYVDAVGQGIGTYIQTLSDLMAGAGNGTTSTGYTFGSNISRNATTHKFDFAAATSNLTYTINLSSLFCCFLFTISNYSTGSLTLAIVQAGVGTSTVQQNISGNGDYYFWGYRSAADNFRFAGTGFTGSISNIQILVPAGNHARAGTSAARPIIGQDGSVMVDGIGNRFFDLTAAGTKLTAQFAVSLGSGCGVAYCTSSGWTFLDNQTLSGAIDLPTGVRLYCWIGRDTNFTSGEKSVIAAAHVAPVTHAAEYKDYVADTPVTASALPFGPPILYRRNIINLTDANCGSFSNLPGGDYEFIPQATPFHNPFNITSTLLARHRYWVGGQSNIDSNYDSDPASPTYQRLLDNSDWADYGKLWLNGTGIAGTFKVKIESSTFIVGVSPRETANISYPATAADILSAVNTLTQSVYGHNGALTVTGSGTSAAPWIIVREENACCGTFGIDTAGLTGTGITVGTADVKNDYVNPNQPQGFVGCCWTEGLDVVNDNSNDGFDVVSAASTCVYVVVNCRLRCGRHIRHDNEFHGDGLQGFGFGGQLYVVNVDLLGLGGNGLILEYTTGGNPQALWDPVLINVYSKVTVIDDDPTRLNNNAQGFYFTLEGTPWNVDFTNCWTQLFNRSDGSSFISIGDDKHFIQTISPSQYANEAPHLRAVPPGGSMVDGYSPGTGYTKPGYLAPFGARKPSTLRSNDGVNFL